MTVYKICFDGNYCVFKNLEDAKEMLICEMGGIEEMDITKERQIKKLTHEDLKERPYRVGNFSLKIDEISEKEFSKLPEFTGW